MSTVGGGTGGGGGVTRTGAAGGGAAGGGAAGGGAAGGGPAGGGADRSGDGGFDPAWLALREPADAQARAGELLGPLRAALPADGPAVVRDLGCGTGSLGRWLAPRLPGAQRWVLTDRDPQLLRRAAADPPRGADGAPVEVRTEVADVAAVDAAALAGTSLVACSALLDLLTAAEVAALAAACAAAGCPALFTLSVVGDVRLHPADERDATVAAAFDAHQRRTVDGRRLLGPDAVDVAAAAFRDLGARVDVAPSPWRLGPEHAALTTSWLRGWVGAAAEQRPDLDLADYLAYRSEAARAGRLRAVIGHADLLARFG